MKVSRNRVVEFDYELRNSSGDMLSRSQNGESVSYLHGHGQIVSGLEQALEGSEEGDLLDVTVDPDNGYGDRDPEKVFRVDREQIPSHIPLQPGTELIADDGMGHAVQLKVLEANEEYVVMDANHPLAGQILSFSVKVRNVREASADELLHGHVHTDEPSGPD